MESFWKEYRADVEKCWQRRPAFILAVLGPIAHRGLRATFIYRIAHRLHRFAVLRPLAGILKRLCYLLTGAEIHPGAKLGGGLHLPHPQGIVIGEKVTVQGSSVIFQDVVLGPRNSISDEGPTLGRNTYVYPGARLIGKLQVGDRVQVGPNCVVYRDLPEGSTVLPPEPIVLEGLSFGLRFGTEERRVQETAV